MTGIRVADHRDIRSIAALHTLAFPGFFLTDLGEPFLRAYYGLVQRFTTGIVLVAERDAHLVGFVAGFIDPGRFYRQMSRERLRFLIPIALGVLQRPWLIARVLGHTRRVSGRAGGNHGVGVCELSSIAVAPPAVGQGIGKQLVMGFLNESRSRGVQTVYLTTDTHDNEHVNAMYDSLGFTLWRQIVTVGGRRMNEYTYDFAKDATV